MGILLLCNDFAYSPLIYVKIYLQNSKFIMNLNLKLSFHIFPAEFIPEMNIFEI